LDNTGCYSGVFLYLVIKFI